MDNERTEWLLRYNHFHLISCVICVKFIYQIVYTEIYRLSKLYVIWSTISFVWVNICCRLGSILNKKCKLIYIEINNSYTVNVTSSCFWHNVDCDILFKIQILILLDLLKLAIFLQLECRNKIQTEHWKREKELKEADNKNFKKNWNLCNINAWSLYVHSRWRMTKLIIIIIN